MRIPVLVASLAFGLVPLIAHAGNPSAACRDGATSCREAWGKLEKCEQANPGKKDACIAERTETDAACKESSKACHTDGSRRASK